MAVKSPIEVEINNCPMAEDGSVRKNAVVIDRAGNRAWSGEGATESEAATEAVQNFISDRRAREYVPS